MCEHKWVPYIMLAIHPKNIMGNNTFIMGGEVHSLVTTKVKCIECKEEREVALSEPEANALKVF